MDLLHNSLFIALVTAVAFVIAYYTYGRFLARRLLGLDTTALTPAHRLQDGVDYVPTHPGVLFGHHFASIAGLGPIVGPAIAICWGWGPALLWVVFGSIFIGAVHDLATLYASLRHEGRGLGDLTDSVIGKRARMVFLLIIFFLLALAMGVFALYMAKLFTNICPQAVVPTAALIGIALLIGLMRYRWAWRLGPVTAIGLAGMVVSLYIGLEVPVPVYKALIDKPDVRAAIATYPADDFPAVAGHRGVEPEPTAAWFDARAAEDPAVAGHGPVIRRAASQTLDLWTYLLLGYAFVASVLPVWLLLQPRDYINSFQLYFGLAAILLGLAIGMPRIAVPAFATQPATADPMFPFLFITIACGAISGFHSLVSSGTTVRQLANEGHAQLVGYGAMLTEGFLAVLVILACVSGLSAEAFERFYAGARVDGLGAFLTGAGAIIAHPFGWVSSRFGVPAERVTAFSTSFIAVVVISFAMTTLDSATRLLRFNVEEIGKTSGLRVLANRYVASAIAVAAIGFFAFIRINGQPAGMTLWQLFGTTNQLLAAIGLLVVSVMLYKMGKPIVYTAVPMAVMVVSVVWAMIFKLGVFWRGGFVEGDRGSQLLFVVGGVLLLLASWVALEAAVAFRRYRLGRMNDPSALPA